MDSGLADTICGACMGSSEERRAMRVSRRLSRQIEADSKQRARRIHLLILGAGESGKSTLVKQLCILYNDGFEGKQAISLNAVANFRSDVLRNVLVNMGAILLAADTLGLPFPLSNYNSSGGGGGGGDGGVESSTTLNASARSVVERWSAGLTDNARERALAHARLSNISDSDVYEIVSAICTLWSDPRVKSMCERRNEFALNDSAEYLFDALPQLAAPGRKFRPTNADIVRVRNQSTGATETSFEAYGTPFTVVDVGGQRTERAKWIQCFSQVTAVLWVVAISGFDECIREDGMTNRLRESLDLFRRVWCNRFLRRTSFILFLNKMDLMDRKFKKSSDKAGTGGVGKQKKSAGSRLRAAFPEYSGANELRPAMTFIHDLFVDVSQEKIQPEPFLGSVGHRGRGGGNDAGTGISGVGGIGSAGGSATASNNNNNARGLYTHFTCAVDTSLVEKTFTASRDIVLRLNLAALKLI